MISKKGRFIFFHIPRTGGSAVQDCLWGGYTNTQTGTHPRENPDYYAPYNWHAHGFNREPNKKDRPPEVIEYEGKVIDIIQPFSKNDVGDVVSHVGQGLYDWNTNFLGKEKFEEYFKFTFVRNPWDRFISLWVKFKEEPKLQEQLNGLFELPVDTDFKEPQELIRYLLLAQRKGLLLPRWFKPQYEYVHNAAPRVLTNYVGMYEKFQFCFDFLCDRIDVPHNTLPWSGEEHRRKKKEGKHYTEWYDDIMINAIAEIYYHDIRTWGYEFGD